MENVKRYKERERQKTDKGRTRRERQKTDKGRTRRERQKTDKGRTRREIDIGSGNSGRVFSF